MDFQFRDLVLQMESTPLTVRTRLRLTDIDEQTMPINLGEQVLACPGRTSGGLISLDSLEDLENALARLKEQLQQAIRSAQGEGTKIAELEPGDEAGRAR